MLLFKSSIFCNIGDKNIGPRHANGYRSSIGHPRMKEVR